MKLNTQKAPLIVGALIIVGLGCYIAVYRSSPGELSQPHAAVAGSSFITDCNKCHAEKNVAPGCLGCHSEIQTQLNRKQGFHAYLLRDHALECARCHSEHNGPAFALINKVSWDNKDPKTFTHPEIEFNLVGKHAQLACDACHNKKFQPAFALPKFPQMPRSETYLGLTQNCGACHKDPHAEGRLSDCVGCHGQTAFVPAVGFDHDRFFALKGGHAKLKCQQCHVIPPTQKTGAGKTEFPLLRQVRGTRCLDCHDNPHRTNWKTDCETCHHVDDAHWTAGSNRMTRAQHALTIFPLNKPHDKARCTQCHESQLAFEKKYPNPHAAGYARQPARCETCHGDPHGGQFVKKHPRCIDCHSLTKFRPPQYGVKEHSSYPLIGGHLQAACNACHQIPGRSRIRRFVGVSEDCATCHKDIHHNQFAQKGRTQCDACHFSFVSWKKISFDHNKQSRFPLDEAHKNVGCAECHPTVTLKSGAKVVQYKPIRSRCEDCHNVSGGK